jgi:hypothetical protein
MEKNGAIGENTPCEKPGCCRRQTEKLAQQTFQFPTDKQAADEQESCLMKDAADAVKQATLK